MDEGGRITTPGAGIVWKTTLTNTGYRPHYLVQCTAPGYRLPGSHVSDLHNDHALPDKANQVLTPGQGKSCPSRCESQRRIEPAL